MQRSQVVMGVVGMGIALAATAARADSISSNVPKQVTLFGQNYAVEIHSLAGTYTNGLKVTQATDWSTEPNTRKSKVDFVQGATPDKDRLFVATAISQDAAAETEDGFYTLTGSDPTAIGQFNTKVSSLEQHFGGSVDYTKSGRPTDVLWLNDTDTGKKKDKNLIAVTFTDDDHYRFYDLDTLSDDFLTDEVGFQEDHVIKGIGPLVNTTDPHVGDVASMWGDPNAPWDGFMTFARTANPQYLIATAHPDSTTATSGPGVEMGIMDVNTTQFLPVLTNLTDSLPTHDDGNGNQVAGYCHALVAEAPDATKNMAPTSNVYWMLYTDAEPGGNSFTLVANQLLRVEIDLPADLTTAKAGDLKIKALGTEDLLKSGLAPTDVDPTNVIYGLGVGRETTPGSGKRIIYLTDWDGNLITLTPQ
jgi:hypothetical protein